MRVSRNSLVSRYCSAREKKHPISLNSSFGRSSYKPRVASRIPFPIIMKQADTGGTELNTTASCTTAGKCKDASYSTRIRLFMQRQRARASRANSCVGRQPQLFDEIPRKIATQSGLWTSWTLLGLGRTEPPRLELMSDGVVAGSRLLCRRTASLS